MERALGKRWGTVGKAVLTLYLGGAMTAYMKVVGDMTVPVAAKFWGDHAPFAQTYTLIPIFSVLLILPLSLLPRVDILGPASFLAVISCTYVAVFIWVDGITRWADRDTVVISNFDATARFFQGVPLVTFAFTGHPLVPPVRPFCSVLEGKKKHNH
jgi:amino acid permease